MFPSWMETCFYHKIYRSIPTCHVIATNSSVSFGRMVEQVIFSISSWQNVFQVVSEKECNFKHQTTNNAWCKNVHRSFFIRRLWLCSKCSKNCIWHKRDFDACKNVLRKKNVKITLDDKWNVETQVYFDRINQRLQKSNAKVIKNNYGFSKIWNKIKN